MEPYRGCSLQLVIRALVVPARVGKSVVGVGRKEPVIRCGVSFSATTSFFELRNLTRAPCSVALKTIARADVRILLVVYWHPMRQHGRFLRARIF